MDVWTRVLAVSAGGVLGVNARYWAGLWLGRWVGTRFPWATVLINVSGSFAIGFLAVVLAVWWPHPNVRLFVVAGLLGGYTTFSAYSLESLALWDRGEYGLALGNMAGSVLAGFLAVAIGAGLGRAATGKPAPWAPASPASAPASEEMQED
ncbi:MAG: fluoride efflux transporter CrcB [Isosphaeraceae bacterium]